MSLKSELGTIAIVVAIGIAIIAWYARPVKSVVTSWTAEASATVEWTETLVTGGWVTGEGKQTLVFIKPQMVETNSVGLEIIYAEAQSAAWKSVDGILLEATTNRSSAQQMVLKNQNLDVILESLKKKSSTVLSAPKITVLSGRAAAVSVADITNGGRADMIKFGAVNRTGTLIKIVPRISPDGNHVDLNAQVQLNLKEMNWLDRLFRKFKK